MKCQRCLSGEAAYHVHTDTIDMKVCAACAAEARRLGIAVEVLVGGEGKDNGRKGESKLQDYRSEFLPYCR
jgi:protein-arginine kinase activator protein McsA